MQSGFSEPPWIILASLPAHVLAAEWTIFGQLCLLQRQLSLLFECHLREEACNPLTSPAALSSGGTCLLSFKTPISLPAGDLTCLP